MVYLMLIKEDLMGTVRSGRAKTSMGRTSEPLDLPMACLRVRKRCTGSSVISQLLEVLLAGVARTSTGFNVAQGRSSRQYKMPRLTVWKG
jgi:hypothetical protein